MWIIELIDDTTGQTEELVLGKRKMTLNDLVRRLIKITEKFPEDRAKRVRSIARLD